MYRYSWSHPSLIQNFGCCLVSILSRMKNLQTVLAYLLHPQMALICKIYYCRPVRLGMWEPNKLRRNYCGDKPYLASLAGRLMDFLVRFFFISSIFLYRYLIMGRFWQSYHLLHCKSIDYKNMAINR